jgi:bifunctional UDP-N-acetylglucosamine pyrophosphorylase/glucosamine-1-phosphate N-acetyltransferase
MKAVILAAGRGTRLEPLTDNRPKQMIIVAGKPYIRHLLDNLQNSKISQILLVTGVTGENLREYVDHLKLSVPIEYIFQHDPKGTAHATSLASDTIGKDPFLLIYGDVLPSNTLLRNTINLFEKHGSPVIISSKVDDSEAFGMVKTSAGLLQEIVEKPSDPTQFKGVVNVGVYIITREILEAINEVNLSPRGELELTDAFNLTASRCDVRVGEVLQDEWIHIGYPWDILTANIKLLNAIHPSINGVVDENVQISGPVVISDGSRVKSGSIIEGPTFIGEGSEIGPNVYLRKYTCIDKNVKIGNSCEIKNSIIMEGTRIPHLSYVGDSIIGSNCNLGAGTITANVRFDESLIKTTVKGLRVSTGERKFGVILGDNVKTGVNVNFMPGVKIGEGAWIGPNIAVSKSIPSKVYVYFKQELRISKLTDVLTEKSGPKED